MARSGKSIDRRSAMGLMAIAGAATPFASNAHARETGTSPRAARSFEDFGVLPDGALSASDLLAAIGRAWGSALKYGHDLYHPGGVYDIGDAHFPWRQDGNPSSLLDCRNITIFGNGPASIFQTSSDGGADVFQLNAVRNIHFRNLGIRAILRGGEGSGSNGVSVTGGYDNITITDVWFAALPATAKLDHLDGGKALTIQCDAKSVQMGSLKAKIFVNGCVYGFGFDGDLVAFVDGKTAIDIDMVAEDCYGAVVIGSPPASSPLEAGVVLDSGISVKVQAINCQRDIILARVHGISIDCYVVTSKPAARRFLDPSGRPWLAADRRVEALFCAYAKNARITISGNKGQCDHKARIGSASAGRSKAGGSTSGSHISLNLVGTATRGDIVAEDDHGPPLTDSILVLSSIEGSLPLAFTSEKSGNLVVVGTRAHMVEPMVSGALTIAGEELGVGRIRVAGGALDFSISGAAKPASMIANFRNENGDITAGVRADGTFVGGRVIAVKNHNATVVAVKEERDLNNILIGYVPIYSGYS